MPELNDKNEDYNIYNIIHNTTMNKVFLIHNEDEELNPLYINESDRYMFAYTLEQAHKVGLHEVGYVIHELLVDQSTNLLSSTYIRYISPGYITFWTNVIIADQSKKNRLTLSLEWLTTNPLTKKNKQHIKYLTQDIKDLDVIILTNTKIIHTDISTSITEGTLFVLDPPYKLWVYPFNEYGGIQIQPLTESPEYDEENNYFIPYVLV
jgi:hypothetical protein